MEAAQSLIPVAHEIAPSEWVRARLMAQAERAVAIGRGPAWVGTSRGRATVVAAVAAFVAVGLGQARGAFPTVGTTSLAVAALLLAVVWALALREFAQPTRWVDHRALIGAQLAAVGVFSVAALLIPVPVAVRYCAEMMLGGLPPRPVDIAGLYLGMAAVYGVVSTGAGWLLIGGVVPGPPWVGPILFTILAGPTLFLQVASMPVLVVAATVCGCLCGATVGRFAGKFAA